MLANGADRTLRSQRGFSDSYPHAEDIPVAKGRRTTHRSASGKKLYAVRDAKGRFKDIQTYERAHRADIKRKSKKGR